MQTKRITAKPRPKVKREPKETNLRRPARDQEHGYCLLEANQGGIQQKGTAHSKTQGAIMRSETLIPLDRVHPPSRDTRERDHQTISDQVADYLAGGGQIKFVDRAESATAGEPIIRNRRDQVAWRKMNNLIKKV